MYLIFDLLRYKNFLSSGNVFIEICFTEKPTTLVVGHNGAGKSTMLDALTFALFGKTYRKINKPTIVNSINNRECVAEINFRVGPKHFRVVRGIKPDIFEIYQDGKLLPQEALGKDYQAYLEEHILRFNYKAFIQIVILGSNFVPFMKLTANDRRVIIDELLDVNILTTMNKVLKLKQDELSGKVADTSRAITTVTSQIEMQKKFLAEAQVNHQHQIDNLKTEITTLQSEMVQFQGLYDDAIKKRDDYKRRVISTERLEIELAAKNREQTVLTNKLVGIKRDAERDLADLKKEYLRLKNEQKFYDKPDCPTCGQHIDAEFSAKKKAEFTTLMEQVSTKAQQVKNFSTEELEMEIKVVVEEVQRLTEVIRDFTARNESHKIMMQNAGSEIVRYQTYLSSHERQTQHKQQQIIALEKKPPVSDDMEKTTFELNEKLVSLQIARQELADLKSYQDVAFQLLKDSGVKARIIKDYLPVINQLINKYLASLNMFVNFELDESFSETIKSRHRDVFSYDSFSEGQKMRIDLALLFAWRDVARMKNSMSTNLLILDEVFDGSLDAMGTEDFMKLLHGMGAQTNVFVISHKTDILADKFENVIQFKEINNFSTMIEE